MASSSLMICTAGKRTLPHGLRPASKFVDFFGLSNSKGLPTMSHVTKTATTTTARASSSSERRAGCEAAKRSHFGTSRAGIVPYYTRKICNCPSGKPADAPDVTESLNVSSVGGCMMMACVGLGISFFEAAAANAAVEDNPLFSSGLSSADSSLSGLMSLLLADLDPGAAQLDPGTAQLAISFVGPFITLFNILLIFRIVMSWYPGIPVKKFPFFLAYNPTEPILGPTRRLIPPVGGVDIAPVIWVALMSFTNEILLGKQGLLVLLSQQQP